MLSEEEVEAVFNDSEGEYFEGEGVTEGTEDYAAYIASRRHLLGPAADVTHPEFGRPNRPDETFAIKYHIELTNDVSPDHIQTKAWVRRKTEVEERVYDYDGNIISIHHPHVE